MLATFASACSKADGARSAFFASLTVPFPRDSGKPRLESSSAHGVRDSDLEARPLPAKLLPAATGLGEA